jgi:hypothetical protein
MKRILATIVMAATLTACSPYFNQANVAAPEKHVPKKKAAFR